MSKNPLNKLNVKLSSHYTGVKILVDQFKFSSMHLIIITIFILTISYYICHCLLLDFTSQCINAWIINSKYYLFWFCFGHSTVLFLYY